MKFKVTITKTSFVEADSVEEANDKALDGDFIFEDEKITSTKRITTSQMRRIMIQLEDTKCQN